MPTWVRVVAASGRPYYYDKSNTKNVVWDKPDDYVEPAPQQQPTHSQEELDNAWKATKTAEGKTYYFNSLSKATAWSLAPELEQRAQAYVRPQKAAPSGPAGYQHAVAQQQPDIRATNGNAMVPWAQKQEGADPGRMAGPAKIYDADFATLEEAEAAFVKLLEDNDVKPGMSFIEVLKLIAKDPVYRGVKDPASRQVLVQKYQRELKQKQMSEEKEKRTKLRADFQKMLAKHHEIVHYTRWKTAMKKFQHEDAFQAISDDSDRRQIFEEHIAGLKVRNHEEDAQKKEAGLHAIEEMLRNVVINPETLWEDAQTAIEDNERFMNDPNGKYLTKGDVLYAFEQHMALLEREANIKRQKEKKIEGRRARKARDNYMSMLNQLREQGKIKAKMQFQDFVKLVADDERYTSLLGTDGSNPLDLFRDAVLEETAKLRIKKNEAMDLLEEEMFEMTTATTLEEFDRVIRRARRRPSHFDQSEIPTLYSEVMEKVKQHEAKQAEKAEKQQRDHYDSFKRDLARLRLRPGATYEDTHAKLTQLSSFQHLDDEETAKKAFAKYMRRVDDDDRERSHRRERRREASPRRSGGNRRTTRSPAEENAYEADRLRQVEARERQFSYRNAETGLTPPFARSDIRGTRRGSIGRSSMDRMDRGYPSRMDIDRASSGRYGSRADPRDKSNRALDYGDEDAVGSGPVSARKRQGSQESGRFSKRARTKSPAKEPSPEYHSGSEEGELAEA